MAKEKKKKKIKQSAKATIKILDENGYDVVIIDEKLENIPRVKNVSVKIPFEKMIIYLAVDASNKVAILFDNTEEYTLYEGYYYKPIIKTTTNKTEFVYVKEYAFKILNGKFKNFNIEKAYRNEMENSGNIIDDKFKDAISDGLIDIVNYVSERINCERSIEYRENTSKSYIDNESNLSKIKSKIKISDKKIIYSKKDNLNKRNYNIHTSEFSRRGHWRTYKTGKKIWIEHKIINRGEGERLTKEYVLN